MIFKKEWYIQTSMYQKKKKTKQTHDDHKSVLKIYEWFFFTQPFQLCFNRLVEFSQILGNLLN